MSRPVRRSILLLDPDASRAESFQRALEQQFTALDAHHLEAPGAADLYLQSARFDAIVAHHTPEVESWLNQQVAQGYPTLAVCADASLPNGLADGVHRCPRAETHLATCTYIAERLRQRWGETSSASNATSSEFERCERVLDAVDHAASRLKHDINNPLSVIAGNAQLLLELASHHHLEGEVVQVARDIQAAVARASELAGELKQLRHQVAHDALDDEVTLAEEPADGR